MQPSLFPVTSELHSLEVVEVALLGAGAVAEVVQEEEEETGRAGLVSRVLDETSVPPRRCNAQPSPEDPPAKLPESRTEKLVAEQLVEAGELPEVSAQCIRLAD